MQKVTTMIRLAICAVMSLAIINCVYFIYKEQADRRVEMVESLQEDESIIAYSFPKADGNAASVRSNGDNSPQQRIVTDITYSEVTFLPTKDEDIADVKVKEENLIASDTTIMNNMTAETSHDSEPVTSLPETSKGSTGYHKQLVKKLHDALGQPEYCNHLQLLSNDSEYNSLIEEGTKVIYQTFAWRGRPDELLVGGFDGCEYSNCVVQQCNKFDYVERANILLFDRQSTSAVPVVPEAVRITQTWVIHAVEAPAWSWNRVPEDFGAHMDVAYTYRSDSDIYRPYARITKLEEPVDFIPTLVQTKTKGAFIYVSNCLSNNYDRLGLIDELSKYIDVRVYGKCGEEPPCPRGDIDCEYREHSGHHFFLSFENSLCTDYITEKFYKALEWNIHVVPVVVGGASVDEYNAIAPARSFIHLYDFESVQALGHYLKYLMDNSEAYMEYHKWRTDYRIYWLSTSACQLCEMANFNSTFEGKHRGRISTWYNDGVCHNLTVPYI